MDIFATRILGQTLHYKNNEGRCYLKFLGNVCLFCVMWFIGISYGIAQSTAWVLQTNKNGIEVYQRDQPDGFGKEVKGIAYVRAPFDDVIRLYEDKSLYESWCHKCKVIKEVKRINDFEKIIYYKNDMPWLTADRESLSHHQKIVDLPRGKIRYVITNIDFDYPQEKGTVRVVKQEGLWRFTELDDGRVELYYQQYADVGGRIPQWIVDRFMTEVPYQTLKNFKNLILSQSQK